MYSSITETEMKYDENIELNLVRRSNHTKKISNALCCMALVSIMATVTQFFLLVSIFDRESNRAKQSAFPMAAITVLNVLSLFASMFMVAYITDIIPLYQSNKLNDLSEDNRISNQQYKCSLSVVNFLSLFPLFANLITTAFFSYEMTR